mgnify:FL=1
MLDPDRWLAESKFELPWAVPATTNGRAQPPPIAPKTPEQAAEDERLAKLAKATAERFRAGAPR